MEQKSAVATQMKRVDGAQLIVPADQLYQHIQGLIESIARRAYQTFESRGCTHGHDCEDWFRAESELLQPVTVELSDSGDAFLVIVVVTGYRNGDLRVSVEPRSLRICGRSTVNKRSSAKSEEDLQRLDGFFVSFDLPEDVDASLVSANIRRDLLEVRLPKMRC